MTACCPLSENDWLRSLRDQCRSAGVPFFLKQMKLQLGSSGTTPIIGEAHGSHRKPGGIIGSPYLDGVQHLEFPPTKKGNS